MINPKNKRVTITLDPIAQELLNTLAQRYNKSFSDIFKWALNCLAAKKNHNIVIKLKEQQEQEQIFVDPNNLEYKEIMKIFKDR